MRRPSTVIRRQTLGLGIIVLVGLIGRPADAGPLVNSYKQWSMQRQTRSQVEKPFWHQSGNVDMGAQPSALHRLRERLMPHPKENITSHQMKTIPRDQLNIGGGGMRSY